MPSDRSAVSARRIRALTLALLAAATLFSALTATAAGAAPRLKVGTVSPDYVAPGDLFFATINIQNVGEEPLSGPLTVTTDFPAGTQPADLASFNGPAPSCSSSGQRVTCTIDATGVEPGVQLRYRIDSWVEPSAAGPLEGGRIEVSGAGSTDLFSEPLDIVAADAPDAFALSAFDVSLDPSASGLPPTQAGADPGQISTLFSSLSQARATFGVPTPTVLVIAPTENFRETIVHVPPGFLGDPTATPVRCTQAQLAAFAVINEQRFGTPACPPASQVGVAQLNTGDIVGVYNLVPPPGSPAAFGFFYNSIVTTLTAHLRLGDDGVDIFSERAASSVPLPKIEVTLWGDPTSAAHDHLRGTCLQGGGGYAGGDCSLPARNNVPFLRNPTSCPGTPLPWSIEMDTYQHPGAFVSKSTATPATEGCDRLPFDPSLSLASTTTGARAPAGLDLALTMPQDRGPDGLAEADLRSVDLRLPDGVTVNPASADGLAACADAQLRLGLTGPSQCPDPAKIGSLELSTPLLEDPISGSVYLRSQASTDPESGDLFRLALEIRSDQRGVDLKLPGSLFVNRDTGRISTHFPDLPQLPFESIQLHLRSGPRAPLTTPSACGTYAAHASLEGWNGRTETLDPAFTLDQSCTPPPFDPGFEAGVTDSTAGRFAPFALRVTRDAGQPNLTRIDATLPEGELARLAGVPVCSGADATAGTCPPASRIGHVLAGIGEGTSPLFLPQPGRQPTAVYLAGPYRGAPYSVLVRVPAEAGPFDLGQVLVRSALRIDPDTARASVLSDPLPQIYAGIPISYRDVRVDVDRPGFTLNPTDCEPLATDATLGALGGATARRSDRFQLSDCAALAFRPRLSLRLRGAVHRRAHPALSAELRFPKYDCVGTRAHSSPARASRFHDGVCRPASPHANIARAQVKLPASALLDQSHIGTICTRPQFTAHTCPPASIYGHASATSPLLDYTLRGNVYLRSSTHKLPDLVADLRGPGTAPIEIALAGKTDSVRGALRNTFEAVPDAPVARFRLELFGGKRGLIEMGDGFCSHPNAAVNLTGQNGKIHHATPIVQAPACNKRSRRHP